MLNLYTWKFHGYFYNNFGSFFKRVSLSFEVFSRPNALRGFFITNAGTKGETLSSKKLISEK